MTTTNIHPALTALETAMAAETVAQQAYANCSQWASRAVETVEPSAWTKRIEAALGNADELEHLRVTYDEKALSAMYSWLSCQTSNRKLRDADSTILEAIRALLALHDEIADHSADSWLKPIFEIRIVEAIEIYRVKSSDYRVDDRSAAFARAYDILVRTFSNLAENFLRSGPSKHYSTELAVPGYKYLSHLNSEVDLRSIHYVEFVDCVNSKHPASQKLAELLSQVRGALDAARLAQARLKGGQNQYSPDCSKINNGTINEKQHANRMMDVLHGQGYSCSPTATQVAEQNERRRLYEGIRTEVLIANRQLKELLETISETLHAAVVETHQLLTEIQADKYTTVDRWETIRISMNNCLAADLSLRTVGRELKQMESTYCKDYSAGAGREAVKAKFDSLTPRYRPFKTERKEKTPEVTTDETPA